MTARAIASAGNMPDAPPKPILYWLGWGALAVALMASIGPAELRFDVLVRDSGNIGAMLADFVPPDFTQWQTYIREMGVTLAVALWGTVLAVLLAIPFGLMGAKNIAPSWLHQIIRRLMDAFRAINEMVFALIFVAAVGLGPFAGILALLVHTTGVLAKLFSEAVEAIDPRPVEGIRATGAGTLGQIRFGVIPQVLPLWLSFVLYRFESNVRSATVLGIVGAGGIGQSLYEAIRGFSYNQAGAIMIIIILSVALLDIVSSRLRTLTV
jgi:phosphonate transport system permease protein